MSATNENNEKLNKDANSSDELQNRPVGSNADDKEETDEDDEPIIPKEDLETKFPLSGGETDDDL